MVEKERDIRLAFATAVLLRSGFDAFHYEQLDTATFGEPPSASFMQRVQLSRFLVAQYDDTI